MTATVDGDQRRERIIAGLLHYGTWIASAFIGVGMIMGAVGRVGGFRLSGLNGYLIVKTGVALFILLPVARVTLMIIIFLRERDYLYVAIAAAVLTIIVTGVLVGIYARS